MTVPDQNSRMDYTGNGSADEFAFTFRIFDEADLLVTERDDDDVETELVLNTDYTVDGVDDPDGGTVTRSDGNLPSGYTLTIRRRLELVQETDLRNQGAYLAETVERQFDRQAMIAQQQQDELDRSLKLPETMDPDDFDMSLPVPEGGSQMLAINSTNDGLTLVEPTDTIAFVSNPTVDHFDAGTDFTAGVTTSLTLSATPGTKNNTIVTFDGVVQHKDTYSISGTTITFTSAIPGGVTEVEVAQQQTIAVPLTEVPDGTDLSACVATATGSTADRTFAARFADVFNVKDFGAVGDGTTDDTAAIQAAISAIPTTAGGTLPTLPSTTAQGGYAVYLPRGVYKITSKLIVGARRMMFIGNGMIGSNGTILYQTDANADFIDYYTGSLDGISVYGIQFYGAGKASGTGNAIRLGRAAQTAFSCQFQRCWFTAIPNACIYADYVADMSVQGCALENARYGVYVANQGISEGDIGKIEDNTLYGLTYGVYAVAGSNLLIQGNQINLCGTNPGGAMDNTSGGIVLIKGAAPSVRATTISGNSFRGNVNDIILDGSTGSAIGTNTGVIDTNVNGNTSDRCYRRFILVDDADGTRIVGNAITAPNAEGGAFDAIDITDTSDGTFIDGNSISVVAGGTPRYGLSLGTSTVNTTLGNNLLTGSTAAVSLGAAATFVNKQNLHGTWTPTLAGAGVAGANTYAVQSGKWTRFGDLVWATCQIYMTAKDAAMAGGVSVRGLPFAVNASDHPVSAAIGAFCRIALGADEHLGARTSGSVAYALDLIASNDAGALSAIDTADLTPDVEIDLTIVYRPSTAAINSGTTVL